MDLLTFSDRVFVYRWGPGLACLIWEPPRPGAPMRWVPETVPVIRALAEALVAEGHLWRFGGEPVFIWDGRPQTLLNYPAAAASLGNRVYFASCPEVPSTNPSRPGSTTGEAVHPDTEWRLLCEANGWNVLDLNVSGKLVQSMLRIVDLPEYVGTLNHPVVGDLPPGTFAPGAPALPTPGDRFEVPLPSEYPHLRALFSGLPLEPIHRLRLYAYLLYHFHARSLEEPSPLLLVDSWQPSMGKTQAACAIEYLIDGTWSPTAAPMGGDTEGLVSHFLGDRRMVVLDNLDSGRPWQNAWISNLLTSRSAGARGKYNKLSTAFRGRMVAVTAVYGYCSLHADLRDRTWRVELPGRGDRVLFDQAPIDYVRKHRPALLAEAYHAASTAPTWQHGNPAGDRAPSAVSLGMAAACHVLGVDQAWAAKLLADFRYEGLVFDPRFVRAVAHAGACSEDLYTGQSLPSRGVDNFVGLSACGLTARAREGRVVLEAT
jgi:hypothetical protein